MFSQHFESVITFQTVKMLLVTLVTVELLKTFQQLITEMTTELEFFTFRELSIVPGKKCVQRVTLVVYITLIVNIPEIHANCPFSRFSVQ